MDQLEKEATEAASKVVAPPVAPQDSAVDVEGYKAELRRLQGQADEAEKARSEA